jgi:hypothetical protein
MKNMKKLVYFLILSFLALKSFSQSAEIRPNQGISVPQFTTVFINAMTTQPKGTVVFDKDINTMKYWTGTVWQSMGAGASSLGWTASGSDIVNSNIGNVGIGNSSPSEAKLVVNATTNTNAVFGSNGTGISLQKNYPTVGFNQYRDVANVQRYIGTGYAMGNFMDPGTGTMYWNAISTGASGATTPAETNAMKLTQNGALGPKSLEAPTSGLSMFGGNDISPIVSNTSNDGTLNITSSSGLLLSGGSFLALDRNSIQARGSSFGFGGGGFSKFESNLRLNPFGGKVGINSGSINLTANLEVYRAPTSNAGSAVFKGTTHYSHFHFGVNEDTYIRGGKDGGKVIINDIPNGNIELAGKVTVNQDLSAPQTGGLNLVPLGIFSYNLYYDNILPNGGSVTNEIGNITTGYTISADIGLDDDDVNFVINLNPTLTSGYTGVLAIGNPGFKGPNYVSKAQISNNLSNVYLNYTVDNILGRRLTTSGRVIVYGIR